MSLHHIVDRVTGKPYIAVDYPTARAARRARADRLVVQLALVALGFPAPEPLGRRAPRVQVEPIRSLGQRTRHNARRRELAAAE